MILPEIIFCALPRKGDKNKRNITAALTIIKYNTIYLVTKLFI